jgi:hypothetical protein
VDEDYAAQFQREWTEFLNEVRVALPGVQFLFAFLLSVPFTDRFARMDLLEHAAYFGCFLCTAVACAFLMAPSVYHRLHWRRDVQDKEQMLRTANLLAITGIALMALAMCAAVFMLSTLLIGVGAGLAIATTLGALFGWLWFAFPLLRRGREQRARKG